MWQVVCYLCANCAAIMDGLRTLKRRNCDHLPFEVADSFTTVLVRSLRKRSGVRALHFTQTATAHAD
jgi:hypothetical protein